LVAKWPQKGPIFTGGDEGRYPNFFRREPAALLKEHVRNTFPSKSHSPWDPSFGAPHAVSALRAMRGHAHGHQTPRAWAVSAHHWKALECSCLVHFSSLKSIECAQSYGRSCVGAFPDHHVRRTPVGTGSRTRHARCSRVMHRFLTHIDALQCPRAWPICCGWASADPSEQQPSAVHRTHSAAFPRSPGQEYSPRRLYTAICRPECAAEACTSAAG
jgi:hypothetical protein